MKSLEKKYHSIFNFFLWVIPVSFIAMKLANILVIAFVLFNVLFYNKLNYNREKIILCSIIAIPLLLDILFLWNNDSFYLTIKATEKHLLFLVFPLIIIGYNSKINLKFILRRYVTLMLVVMLILFIRYIIIYPEYFSKYLSGKHLWEMGYHFCGSFGIHAPWLNMHLAFVSVSSFYLLMQIKTKNLLVILSYLIQFIVSLFFLLYVNTRLAVVTAMLGYGLIALAFVSKNQSKRQIVKKVGVLFIIGAVVLLGFVKAFPYSIQKFTSGSFVHMDMVGRLDEFKNPEAQIFSALVTRVSIWKSALELSNKKLLTGYGATGAKEELFKYYKETNQNFLYKFKFPVHNQFIDFLLKYGFLGFLAVFVFIGYIGYIGIITREPIIIFFSILFLLCNLTDDFLILYAGISFSSFWFSIFGNCKINLQLNEKS